MIHLRATMRTRTNVETAVSVIITNNQSLSVKIILINKQIQRNHIRYNYENKHTFIGELILVILYVLL